MGDQISFEVAAPSRLFETEDGLQAYSIEVRVGEEKIGMTHFGYSYTDMRASLLFGWDTTGMQPGQYDISVLVKPFDILITRQVKLLPASDLPEAEVNAELAFVQTDCCTIFYITGTDAERDLESITQLIENEYIEVKDQFQVEFPERLNFFLYPRQLGQGGFSGIYLSYNSEGYLPGDFEILVHHEISHMADAIHCPYYRPMMLVEGIMLYVSGGHFRSGPSLPRTAAMLELGEYIPLRTLAGGKFYELQHEYSYLEASALVEYLINTYGWEEFDNFYCDIMDPGPYTNERETFEMALDQHFSLTIDGLEDSFLAELENYTVTTDLRDDVRLTAEFFETIRRYQALADPAAYSYSIWLPPINEVKQSGVVTDYLREPNAQINQEILPLLIQARQQWEHMDFSGLEQTLAEINSHLDGYER